MYFVYYGYVSPDSYDCCDGPLYKIKEFNTGGDVEEFYKEFMEEVYEDCTYVEFRVFEGTELNLTPKEKVTSWELIER